MSGDDGGHSASWRDKDPPPAFEGDVSKFKSFVREVKIWQHETDVPKKKHGAKLLRVLGGPAKALCEEIELEELLSEKGLDAIMSKLKEYYQPHLESSLPRAFEKAVYGEPRKNKEGFNEYVLRQEAAFRALSAEGVTLEDKVKGYVMFRQANLSQAQEDQVVTWSEGKYERSEIIKAFRKLDKVVSEKGQKTYAAFGGEEEEEDPNPDDSEESSEEYVYIGESDLQQVYEEDEIQEALATYQQVRRAIKDQRKGRGYYPAKGSDGYKGSGKSFSGRSSGKGQAFKSIKFSGKAGGTKIHVDLLKLRTKCARCGQIGHLGQRVRQ